MKRGTGRKKEDAENMGALPVVHLADNEREKRTVDSTCRLYRALLTILIWQLSHSGAHHRLWHSECGQYKTI